MLTTLAIMSAVVVTTNLVCDVFQAKETHWQDFLALWDRANNSNAQSDITNPQAG